MGILILTLVISKILCDFSHPRQIKSTGQRIKKIGDVRYKHLTKITIKVRLF